MTLDLLHEEEPSFASLLADGGIGKSILRVLEEQKVLSLHLFRAMKEDHLVRLLQCNMPVGEHALLWEVWEKESASYPTCYS